METKRWIKKISVVSSIVGVGAMALLAGCTTDTLTNNGVPVETQEQLNALLESAETAGFTEGENSVDVGQIQTDARKGYVTVQEMADNIQAAEEQEAQRVRDEEHENILNDVLEEQRQTDAQETQEDIDAHEFEDVFLNEEINDVLSDRDVAALQDGEIEFDGNDYDIEESLELSGLKLSINENDYNGAVYLTAPTGGLVYEYTLESEFDPSEIDEDETLEINFLGRNLEISEWDGDEITFTEGTEFFLEEGESVTVGDSIITLTIVGEEFVYVDVDGEGEKIFEDRVEKVGDLEIKAEEVLYRGYENAVRYATLKIGGNVEETVEDGDEWDDDSEWEWTVDETTNTLGLVLVEEFTDVDQDEEFRALGNGDVLSFPYGFLNVAFDGLVEEDVENYGFDLAEKSGDDYLRVRGEFLDGIEDFQKVFINSTGIYDDDLELIGNEIDLGDTDLTLELSGGNVVIDDIEIELDLSDVTVDGDSIANEDDDFLTEYGVTIDNPEDDIEDERLRLSVPEERTEGIVRVY